MSDGTSHRVAMIELAPAYALGALAPEEARAFEQALADSPELQRELAEYREVCGLLAAAEPKAPPAALKQRLLARVHQSKGAVLAPRPSARPLARRGGWTSRLMSVACAAVLLLSVVLWNRVGTLSDQVAQRDSALTALAARLAGREAQLNAILEPGVQLITLTATGEAPPIVQVFWDRPNRSALMHLFRTKPAPAGRAYQLWFLPRQGRPIASSVFNTEPDGHGLVASIAVPAGQEIVGFALTEEPAAGSPQPTTVPIVSGMAAPLK